MYDETTSNALGYPPGYTVSDSTYSTYENINNDAYFQKIEDNNTIASPGDEMELASVSKVDKIISIDGSETSHINMSDFMNSITHPSLSKTFDQNNASHPIKVATNNI